MKAQMTELHKIIQIRENLYHGLKKYADPLGLTVEEYAELLITRKFLYSQEEGLHLQEEKGHFSV